MAGNPKALQPPEELPAKIERANVTLLRRIDDPDKSLYRRQQKYEVKCGRCGDVKPMTWGAIVCRYNAETKGCAACQGKTVENEPEPKPAPAPFWPVPPSVLARSRG